MTRLPLLLATLAACGPAPQADPEVAIQPSEGDAPVAGDAGTPPAKESRPTALHFVDGTAASGLGGFQQLNGSPEKHLISESFGAGVALVDVDGDGDLDAYLTNGGPAMGDDRVVADALYLNDGSGQFVDGTVAAGLGDTLWSYGVCAADFDGDGDLDLYVTNRGANRLYVNDGRGVFTDRAEAAGVAVPEWSTGAVFFDYDRDGDLDLYVVNHIDFDKEQMHASGKRMQYFNEDVYYGPLKLDGASDRLFRNTGQGTFEDVSELSGIGAVAMFGFQAVCFDYDQDGWLDLYVANDSNPNVLWRNTGQGTFEDVASTAMVALSQAGDPQAGMGVAVGDFNGDLLSDLFVTNFSEDYFNLYERSSRGRFRDVTARARLHQATMPLLGWACAFEDFDSDGDEDLFAANGHVFPQVDNLRREETTYLQRNSLFENEGARFGIPDGAGGPGFSIAAASRGAAIGDVDGDGDRDILIGNLDGPPSLLLNEGQGCGQSLLVKLVGSAPNTAAIGARVQVKAGGATQLRLAGTQSGFLSTGSPRLHFGLGTQPSVELLSIIWPDGSQAQFEGVAAGAVVITQGAGLQRADPVD